MRAYLDNLATTPIDPAVLEAMMPHLAGPPGNPHATSHPFGQAAARAIEAARAQVAAVAGAKPGHVFFTPSATTANNLGVIGGATGRERRGRHVLVSAIEHPSVLEPARELALRGFEVEEVGCGPGGVVDPDEVRRRMRPDTVLVALIAVNNEVGTVQPVREVAAAVHAAGALLHCDAAQAPGKVALDAFRDADFLTLSSHKVYGPKGAAALVVRSKGGFRPKPIVFGGGQEEGLWPGTVNVAAVAGFGRAMELAAARLEADRVRIAELCDVLVGGLTEAFPGSRRNGDPAATVPHCASVTLSGVAGETVLSALARGGVAASFGSACATESNEPSHVLTAMGLMPAECRRTLRFGIGRFTTREEIEHVLAVADGVSGGRHTPM